MRVSIEELRELAEHARDGDSLGPGPRTWWLWDEPEVERGPLLSFAQEATPEAVLELIGLIDRRRRRWRPWR